MEKVEAQIHKQMGRGEDGKAVVLDCYPLLVSEKVFSHLIKKPLRIKRVKPSQLVEEKDRFQVKVQGDGEIGGVFVV